MRIDLRGIQEGTHPLVLDGREAVLVVDEKAGSRLSAYRFEGALTLVGRDCQVRGSLSGILETACDRCLTPFDREVEVEIDTEVVAKPAASRSSGEPASTAASAPAEHGLDLAGPLQEAVLLEIPIKNVCSGECRGICPRCGTNRNVKSCDCVAPEGDPRWEALEGLSFSSDPEE